MKSLNQATSRLGFGCASMGSRVSKSRALKALNAAFEQGIVWYDVAPSYGDGAAEEILSEFLAGKHEQVQVCTKVGFTPVPPTALMYLAKPLLRTATAIAPALRPLMRRRRSAERLSLSGAVVERSVNESLRRLGRDQIDVLALHEPRSDDLHRDDVRRSLEDLVSSGRIRAVSLAVSTGDDVAALQGLEHINILQAPANAFNRSILDQFGRVPERMDVITHSAYGSARAIPRLAEVLRSRPDIGRAAKALGYDGPKSVAAANLLADYAFASNPNGLILMSMFHAQHLRDNLDRASSALRPEVVDLLNRQALGSTGTPL